MADPLSVSASIGGLVTLADLVFCRIYKYVQEVKGASKDISALSSEISALYGILSCLKLVSDQLQGEMVESAIRVHHIESCYKTLDRVKSILDRESTSSLQNHRIELITRRLRWPFTSPEVTTLIKEIERHKATLGLALNVDGMSGLLQSLSIQREISENIDVIKTEARRRHEAETRVNIDKERQKMLQSFGQIDPTKNQKMGLKLRQPGTGLWLIEGEDFQDWLKNDHAKLWFYGIPGAGKTVLASIVVEEVLRRANPGFAVAYFYCDYKNPETHRPASVIGSLVQQIAKQDKHSLGRVQAFCKARNPDYRDDFDYDLEELRELLLDMSRDFDCSHLIVDGLDECGAHTTAVVELLASLNVEDKENNLKTLFLSRNESDIRDHLLDYTQVAIAAKSSDLRLYVGSELDLRVRKNKLRIKDQALKGYIMDRLVEGAEGMFRWVACQMDWLCELPNDSARRKALENLPPTLNATYERILRRINSSSRDVQLLVSRTLRWIVHAITSLSIKALREAIAINIEDDQRDINAISDGYEILRWCSSLVRIAAHREAFELAHFTVKEYLLQLSTNDNDEFALYRIKPGHSNNELAKTCLTYLNFKDFDQEGCASAEITQCRFENYPFREYAVTGWAIHAQGHLDDAELLGLIKKLLSPSKPNTLVSWAQDNFRRANWYRNDNESTLSLFSSAVAKASALHYAAMLTLPQVCTWLLESGCAVNHESGFGTPLHCALLETGALLLFGSDPFRHKWRTIDPEQRCVIDILLEAGADLNCSFNTPTGPVLPLFISLSLCDPRISVQLLEKGGKLDERCIIEMEDGMQDEHLSIIVGHISDEHVRPEYYSRILELATPTEKLWPCHSLRRIDLQSRNAQFSKIKYEVSLRTAAKFGQLETITWLLKEHDLDLAAAEDRTGYTALHYAAIHDHVEVVKLLLAKGAHPWIIDGAGHTAVHASVQNGRLQCLKVFLQEKNFPDKSSGFGLLRLACQDKQSKSLEILEELHKSGLPIDDYCPTGQSTLMVAAMCGNVDFMKLLISKGAHLDSVDNNGRNVIHYACLGGYQATLAALRNTDVDWNRKAGITIDSMQLTGATALHVAAGNRNSRVLEYLLNEDLISDIDSITDDFETALFIAVCQNLPRNVASLLSRNANAKIKSLKGGETPLHLATRLGYHDTIRQFLRYKCDVEFPDDSGLNCEMIAWQNGHKYIAIMFANHIREHNRSVVTSLQLDTKNEKLHASKASALVMESPYVELSNRGLENGKDLHIGDGIFRQCSPLLHAPCVASGEGSEDGEDSDEFNESLASEEEFTEAIISVEASIVREPSDQWTTEGYTGFHYAASCGHIQLLRILLDKDPTGIFELQSPVHPIHLAIANGRYECVDLLLKHEDTHASLLHIAAYYGEIEIAKLIIKRGVPTTILDADCRTPLHFAAAEGRVQMIDFLLEMGANVHAVDIRLYSPCMVAAGNSQAESLQTLIRREADLQMRDIHGLMALHFAALSQSFPTLRTLLTSCDEGDLRLESLSGESALSIILATGTWFMISFILRLAPKACLYDPHTTNILTDIVRNPEISMFQFRGFLKRIPESITPILLKHRAKWVGTPLYAACTIAVLDLQSAIIRALLKAGAEVEQEGGEHGTPLMGACATGRFAAVKLLVSKGARIIYEKDGHVVSALRAARHYPEIIQWLLVGRYWEGPKLLRDNASA